jgi:hypothetical protein
MTYKQKKNGDRIDCASVKVEGLEQSELIGD